MSERSGYPAGVPCWSTCLVSDLRASADFYQHVFGWTFDVSDDKQYAVALLRGRQVAGLGALAAAGPQAQAAWVTEVRVADAAEATRRVEPAGGTVLSGPTDVSPAGTIAVVADPVGAVITLSQQGPARVGAELVNEPSAWAMSTLVAPEPADCASFYRELFGWRLEHAGPVGLWRLPGYVGGEQSQPVPRDVVAVARPESDGPSRWEVDFWVADAADAARTAEGHGGEVLVAPADVDGLPFRHAVLADADGAVFTVSQLLT